MVWTSWMVLAVCTVITQSFPRPDEYQIPKVPFGKRAQYYVLHDDGDFKYGYDTGAGAYESAVRMGGDLSGFFGYNDATGKDVRIDYTAGAGGFLPSGNNLPVVPDVPVPSVRSAGVSPVSYAGSVNIPSHSVRAFEEADVDSTNNLDGSYAFSYTNSDSSRSETADASNNVVGRYSFVADDGQNREIRYRAGSATGYVAEGDSIPEVSAASAPSPAAPTLYNAPARSTPDVLYRSPTPTISVAPVPAPSTYQHTSEPRGDASYSFKYINEDSAREESADSDLNVRGRYSFVADDGIRRNVNYIAGSATGFVAEGDHLPVAPDAGPSPVAPPAFIPAVSGAQEYSASFEPRNDASYQFNYATADSSRSESSDSDLNVRGDYSFVADDGQRRTVNYIAGSSTGFVAQGDHLPVAPEVPAVAPQPAAPVQFYSAPQPSVAPVPIPTRYTAESSQPRGDASYNFNYQNEDSSRTETADSDLNVQGEYSFVGDDGQTRRVTYRAGSDTGFVAEGAHLPVDTPISPAFTSASTYSASAGSSNFRQQQPTHEIANNVANQAVDGSYSFSYSNADSSRSETADASNNVVGEYSFIADDGQNRQIRYRAGSDTGFIAEGDSIPVAPDTHVFPQVPVVAPIAPAATLYTAPAASSSGSATFLQPGGDASYSFSYNNEDSSRRESADGNLNVEGTYSFVADDGVHRQVNYIAGSSTGFVAHGDHLPVAPEVPSVGSPTTYAHTSPQVLVKSAPTAPVVSHESANVRSNLGGDGGYSFSYSNSDSSRSESADASNNVVGQYSFVADDGQNRQIRYSAGSGTGFVAEGDSIPVAPAVPETPSVAPTNLYSAPVQSPVTLYSAPVAETNQQSFEPRGDASYNFAYTNEDSAREESADSDLNVRGRYSFVADDGIQRSVNYIAGSATGFVAQGDHLPVAPEASASVSSQSTRFVQPTVYSGFSSGAGTSGVSGGSGASRGDASYSFNYLADGSSRDETADRDLNVRGRYTFVADDGVERTVDYVAGSGTGFVAEGAHLPVPVSVSGAGAAGVRSSGFSGGQAFSSSSSGSSSVSRQHGFSSGSSASSSSSGGAATVYSHPAPSTRTAGSGASGRPSSSSSIVGNVKLNTYQVVPGNTKYGYVYTEI